MRVLVVGTLPEAAEHASEVLREAGHEVVTCHEPGEDAFPCRGLRGEDCPLDGAGVDAVVSRRNARLRVVVTLPPGAEAAASSVTAKVLGVLRQFDPEARGIDLGFAPHMSRVGGRR